MKNRTFFILFSTFFVVQSIFAQRNETKATDANTPLHLLKPDYPTPYGKVEIDSVINILTRIHGYLDRVTPPNSAILAGSEVIQLLKNEQFEINDSSLQLLEKK